MFVSIFRNVFLCRGINWEHFLSRTGFLRIPVQCWLKHKTPDCPGKTRTIYVPRNSIFRNSVFSLLKVLLLDLRVNSDYFHIQHWHCFVLPKRSVYCAERTHYLNKFTFIFCFYQSVPLCLSWPNKWRPTKVVIVEHKEYTEVCGMWLPAVSTPYSSLPIVVLLQWCNYSVLCFSKNLCRDIKQPIKYCLPVARSDVFEKRILRPGLLKCFPCK